MGLLGSISGSKTGPKNQHFRCTNLGGSFGSVLGSFGGHLVLHGVQKMLNLYSNLQHFVALGLLRWGPEGASEGVSVRVLGFVAFWANFRPVLGPKTEP